MDDQESPPEHPRNTGEKLWNATVKTFNTASFRTHQYKRIVQKKIDLNSLHKKIAGLHSDLGRLIDENRELLPENFSANERTKEVLQQLDALKHAAAMLEEEVEAIREEQPEATESA